MKKIKTFLIIMLAYLSLASFGTDTLYHRFTNFSIIPGPTYDTLIFDVEIKSSTAGTYYVGFQHDIDFNSTAFGINAKPVCVPYMMADGGMVSPSMSFVVGPSSPTTSRFRYGITQLFGPYNPATLALVPTASWGKVVKYKMAIINNSGNAGLAFWTTTMAGQQKFVFVLTSTKLNYAPIVASNNLVNLPLNPNMNLIFSELGAPSDSPDNFVEIYNAGSSSVDFDQYYPYYLSINGSSSIQLTGTLSPGGTLVVDITGYPGTSDFELSIHGDYVNGTAFEFYDGGLPGFNFTGKHAVRHFDILTPNLTPDLSEWVISAAQEIDMTAGSHRSNLNWNGGTAAWRNQANWTEGFIPDAAHNVVIPNSGTTPMISNGMNAYSHDLAVGTVGLIIESDMTNGDGSLITYGIVSGSASVQRFLDADRFWYITQPVVSTTANVFLHTWMFTYNESSSDWSAFIEDETTPLNRMKGYAVWTSSINKYDQDLPPLGDTTTAYNGVLNTGAISTPLTKGGNGWNFVGNPYPSAVDWDATGWTRTNLSTNAYYVWDGATYASYIVGGPGTNGGTQYIPAAQGFFVNASAAGTLGVTDAVRTHSTQDFWKSDENKVNLLSLTVSNGNVNDETVIYFNEGATPGLDYNFDARKLMAPAAPQLYTMMENDKMSINTFNSTNQTNTVTMGVNAPEAGDYTITGSNVESFDASIPIYLEDLVTGQKVNLREMSTYAFTASEGTSERFAVHFAEYQGIGDNPVTDINSIYVIDRTVYVDFNAEKGEIAIYNILGQEISRTAASFGLNEVSTPLGNAVYIVKVISDNSTVTKKVFVK